MTYDLVEFLKQLEEFRNAIFKAAEIINEDNDNSIINIMYDEEDVNIDVKSVDLFLSIDYKTIYDKYVSFCATDGEDALKALNQDLVTNTLYEIIKTEIENAFFS